MAVHIIKIPKTNPIHFTEVDKVIVDQRYNNFAPFEDSYWNQIKSYEAKRPFAQKWQFNDRIQFQISVDSDLGSYIELTDIYGSVLFKWDTYSTYSVPGNVFGTTPLITIHWSFSFSDYLSIQAGFYLLKLTVPYDTGTGFSKFVYESDPVFIAPKHNNTVLLEYRHKVNKYDTIFTQTGALFSLRIEGSLHEFQPTATDTMYKDQVEKVRLLSSYPSELYKLTIGGSTGMPEYLYNVVNRAMSCSYKLMDGCQIEKDENAKWETVRTAHNPLVWATLPIRKLNTGDSIVTTVQDPVYLFNNDNSHYPYFIHTVVLTNGTTPKTLPIKVITGAGDEIAYLSYLNTVFKNSNSLTGSFITDNGSFYYINGDGESYSFNPFTNIPIVLFESFTVLKDITGAIADTISINFTADYIGASWIADHSRINKYGSGGSTNFNAGTSYYLQPSKSNETIRIFHNHNVTKFEINYNVVLNPLLKGIGGQLPVQLQQFILSGFAGTSLNLSILSLCATGLQKLHIKSGNLSSVSSANQNYSQLVDVDFSGNKLPPIPISVILGAVANKANGNIAMSNGVCHVEGQTPPAPLNSPGLSSKAILQSNGWSVFND